jgi:hypothetical protein
MYVQNKATLKAQLTSEASLYDVSTPKPSELPKFRVMSIPNVPNVHIVRGDSNAMPMAAIVDCKAEFRGVQAIGRNPMQVASDLLTQIVGEAAFVLIDEG